MDHVPGIFIILITCCWLCQGQDKSSEGFVLTLNDIGKSRQDAQTYCKSSNSWLAEIKTEQLQKDLKVLMGSRGGWIGGKYSSANRRWQWADGSAFRYKNWRQDQNAKSGKCIELDGSQQWTKYDCAAARRFICQRDPCTPDPCSNGGNCSWNAESPYYECACREVYQGQHCTRLKYPLNVENCRYHLNHYESLNAQNAATRCQNDMTSLAIFTSETTRNEMISEIEKLYGENPINFWIGAKKDGDNWWWDNNSNISSNTLEQTASGNCLTLKYSDSSTSLVSAKCASSDGFICEKPNNGKPCDSQSCNDRGTCVNVGCHYKCTCQAGYGGKDCERDLMVVTTPGSQLSVFRGEKLNITLNIDTMDFPVDITLCKDLQYETKIDSIQTERFLTLVGPFSEPNAGIICSIVVISKTGGYSRDVSINITVLAPAKISGISPDSIAIPYVSGPEEFVCSFSGQPTPDIKWYTGSELVQGWNKNIQSTGGVFQRNKKPDSLYVKFAREADAGNYTCQVHNTIVIGTTKMQYTNENNVILRVSPKLISKKIQPENDYVEEVEVSCSYKSYPRPTISWKYIKYSKPYDIYSETGSIFNISSMASNSAVVTQVDSTLQIRLADCLGAVKIECVANNTYEASLTSFLLNQRYERKAQSTPTNQSAKAADCVSTITVSWKPAKRAVGIKHRVELKPESDVLAIKPTPIDILARDEMYHNEFRNLSYATKYNIKIYVCPDQCLPECHTFQQVTTGPGLPEKVKRINVSKSDISSVCIISWTEPTSAFGILSYKIIAESQFVHFFTDKVRNEIFHETIEHTMLEQLQFNYSTAPNRNYTFSVQPRTCTGLGNEIVAEGRCTTKRAAPPSVPKPRPSLIGVDGILIINLFAIDESNGPASCFFAVVITNPDSTFRNYKYGQEELQMASTNGKKKLNTEYITLALSRKALSDRMNGDGEIALKIGDNSTTWCDASQDSTITRRRRSAFGTTFQGHNIPLNKDKKIGIIIVVATPVGGEEILYKSSEMTEYLSNDLQTSGNGMVIAIVCVAVGVGVIALGLITAYLIKRKRLSQSRDEKRSIEMDPRPQHQETDIGQASSDRDYETIPDPVNRNRSGRVQEDSNPEHPYEETCCTAGYNQTKKTPIVGAKTNREYETISDKHNEGGSRRVQPKVDTEHPYEETAYQIPDISNVRGTANDGAYENTEEVREQKAQDDDGEYEIAQPSPYEN